MKISTGSIVDTHYCNVGSVGYRISQPSPAPLPVTIELHRDEALALKMLLRGLTDSMLGDVGKDLRNGLIDLLPAEG
jgi:hypothetical protein